MPRWMSRGLIGIESIYISPYLATAGVVRYLVGLLDFKSFLAIIAKIAATPQIATNCKNLPWIDLD